ncbi:LuxR C-terminal-related transcriptional regulator [Fulvivirgaceae bacterium BMA12]|uniref:LuxR C-terminal-related transcriptional regulator n=1 Tax=Agaribacillus aureus TaxID=3051825 RepID=A0ABT8LKR3_9BACT|nr:LuxR C-terminal-related transcriptional regulator [Fulvivirgaceae bacterium BMA12]
MAFSITLVLGVMQKINHGSPIDPGTMKNIELDRSKSAREMEKRKYLNLIMFQQVGLVLATMLIPVGFMIFRNQSTLKKLKGKTARTFEEKQGHPGKSFSQRLIASYPDLTPHELVLCEMLYNKLSSKEIALQLNISAKSVNTARYRLRKKLKIGHDVDLITFLLKI